MPDEARRDRGAPRLRHCAALYRLMRRSAAPSSAVASGYLHAKKHLDAADRRAIALGAFSLLRMEALAAHCLEAALRGTDAATSPGSGSLDRSLRDVLLAAVHACLPPACMLPPGEVDLAGQNAAGQDTADAAILAGAAQLTALAGIPEPVAAALLRRAVDAFAALDAQTAAALRACEEAPETADIDAQRELLSARCSVPRLFLESWAADTTLRLAPREQARLACRLMGPADVCARASGGRPRAELIAGLRSSGVACHPARLSPTGIVLEERSDLRSLAAWTEGRLELQDEGSQCVAYALNPAPDWRILDACAGAGGKSLHLADLQGDRGSIDAADADARKLRELTQRAARMGLRSIRIVAAAGRGDGRDGGGAVRSARHPRDLYDAVLVDAPCSGSGTVRRFPARKWAITPGMLRRLAARQLALLLAHADAVRPGGVLLYSTCSLLHAENADVVAAFLAERRDFAGDPLAPQLAAHGIAPAGLEPDAWMTTLTPERDGTDGFFIARFRRT